MSTKTPRAAEVKTPDDPDPTPINTGETAAEVQGAARNERKRIAQNYGRTKTILAGNASADNGSKKTILGG